jgi:predicted transcriptional regulator
MLDPKFDPLSELRQSQFQIQELTEAVIQLQNNQNELIKAVADNLLNQRENQRRFKSMEIIIGQQNAEIKDLRNRTATTTDSA